MNYLAHIFLSGPDRQIRLGNFIGDAVKGNSYNDYPSAIRKGILLHRAIDDYTDHHPAFIECVRRLKPCFGRYSSILADIYFDYLLASRFQEFSEVPLKRFTRNFYWTMILYRHRPPGQICFGRRYPQFTGDYGPRRPDRTSGREGRGLPGDARGGTLGGFQAIFRVTATLLCRLDSDTPIR